MATISHPAVVRAVQQPAQGRQATLALGQAAQAQIFQVYGRVELQGVGEATFSSAFPVWFLDAPQVSFGGELSGNKALTTGSFPTISLIVREWQTKKRAGRLYYTGAEFVVKAGGTSDMTMIAHWQCEGTGLTNPLLSDSTI